MSSENTGANGNGDCLGWAATDESGILSPYKFSRRYAIELMILGLHVARLAKLFLDSLLLN